MRSVFLHLSLFTHAHTHTAVEPQTQTELGRGCWPEEGGLRGVSTAMAAPLLSFTKVKLCFFNEGLDQIHRMWRRMLMWGLDLCIVKDG